MSDFNTLLKRVVACIRSSLLLKIQWIKHHHFSEHWFYSVCGLCDHNDAEERRGGILIKESSIKVMDARKSSTDEFIQICE